MQVQQCMRVTQGRNRREEQQDRGDRKMQQGAEGTEGDSVVTVTNGPSEKQPITQSYPHNHDRRLLT